MKIRPLHDRILVERLEEHTDALALERGDGAIERDGVVAKREFEAALDGARAL